LHVSIVGARDAKRAALQAAEPKAWLKPLEPGARTTNKCLGILVSIFGYALDHKLVGSNIASRVEKLPEGEDDESRVIEENVLTPDECIVRAFDKFASMTCVTRSRAICSRQASISSQCRRRSDTRTFTSH